MVIVGVFILGTVLLMALGCGIGWACVQEWFPKVFVATLATAAACGVVLLAAGLAMGK